MAPPVTGPFLSNSQLKAILSFPTGDREVTYWTRGRWSYRQRPPFLEALPMRVVTQSGDGMYQTHPYPWEEYRFDKCDAGAGQPSSADFDNWEVKARNRAYDRFVSKMKGTAGMAQNVAEYRSSLNMITSRATTLYRAVKAVRKFRFAEAADLLGIPRRQLNRMNLIRESQALGHNWLEYWFGWSPLISDIYGAMDILQSPLPYTVVSGSARDFIHEERDEVLSGWATSTVRDVEVLFRLQAFVQVKNPNLYLANEMGLVNPLSLAWNLLPFSWMVDWVANVGQILDSFSDLAGVETLNPFWSRKFVFSLKYDQRYLYNSQMTSGFASSGTRFERFAGSLPGPVFTLAFPERLSATRAATAVALLVQGLKGKH